MEISSGFSLACGWYFSSPSLRKLLHMCNRWHVQEGHITIVPKCSKLETTQSPCKGRMVKYTVVYLYATYGWKKEENHKRIHVVWRYLYKVQKQTYVTAKTKIKIKSKEIIIRKIRIMGTSQERRFWGNNFWGLGMVHFLTWTMLMLVFAIYLFFNYTLDLSWIYSEMCILSFKKFQFLILTLSWHLEPHFIVRLAKGEATCPGHMFPTSWSSFDIILKTFGIHLALGFTLAKSNLGFYSIQMFFFSVYFCLRY